MDALTSRGRRGKSTNQEMTMREASKNQIARGLVPWAATILSMSLALTLRVEQACSGSAPQIPANDTGVFYTRSAPFEIPGAHESKDQNREACYSDCCGGAGLGVSRNAEQSAS